MDQNLAIAQEKKQIRFNFQSLVLFGVLLIVMIISALLSPKFLTYPNIMNVLQQVSMIMLTGSAATILMISGNFDLSVGMVLAFTGVIHAFMSKNGIPTTVSMIMAILIGSSFGLINGVLVAYLKITPVIATLGTMYIARRGDCGACGRCSAGSGDPRPTAP